jgi:DHA1 family tetracycline resistance protein-like MFS transporter
MGFEVSCSRPFDPGAPGAAGPILEAVCGCVLPTPDDNRLALTCLTPPRSALNCTLVNNMKRKPSLLVIFLSVFIDLVGFGIVLPLLPVFAAGDFQSAFTGKGLIIGAIIASFSAMQFFFAPAWGRLSDRIGRRPVMLISNLGAAGSYCLFAIASGMDGTTGLVWLLISRVFAGICGANLSVASAYIADITPPEKRSARMGLIGMAFGLGFIFGPAIGAFCMGEFGKTGPGWVAAGFCFANFLLGSVILGESRAPSSAPFVPRPKFTQWSHTLAQPQLGVLVTVFFFATFCFTCFEATFPLLAKQELGFGSTGHDNRIGYLFTYCGLITAFLQGGIGKLVKKVGEPRLIFISLLVFAVGLAALPYQTSLTGMLVVLALLAIGSGLNRPPVFGLISLKSSADEQGANLGVAQSFGSLARIVGPIFATTVFFMNMKLPYLISGGVALVTAFFAWKYLCGDKSTVPAPASAVPGKSV